MGGEQGGVTVLLRVGSCKERGKRRGCLPLVQPVAGSGDTLAA